MAIALLLALALSQAQPSDQPVASAPEAPRIEPPAPSTSAPPKALTREEVEDAIPEGAPKDDYGFVAWCHGALAGQIELDPLVEKDMDSIEGKEKAARRRADDLEIAKEHKRYLASYAKALSAAEKASPTAIHQRGADAELSGYKIWGPTRNKAPIWRMVDWGNWEVPPRCEKAAKRLYERASLFGEALTSETTPQGTSPAPASAPAATQIPEAAGPGAPPAADTPPAPQSAASAAIQDRKDLIDGLRGPH